MLQDKGNLWDFDADAFVITTNGFVKNNGECVMGRGCAKEAAIRWPQLPLALGKHIERHGNHAGFFWPESEHRACVMSMPVKHHWRQEADITLIERSAYELVEIADELWLREIIMPRPGCGNGRLSWSDVAPVIESILDNRFTVVTF